MGCGSSVDAKPRGRPRALNVELEDTQLQLMQSKKELLEHDQELAALQAQKRGLSEELAQSEGGMPTQRSGTDPQVGSAGDALQVELGSDHAEQSLEALRAELAAAKREHELALEREREHLSSELQQMLDSLSEDRSAELQQSLAGQAEQFQQERDAEISALRREHEAQNEALEASAQLQAQQLRAEADSAEEEIARLTAEFAPLRAAHEEAASELREARKELEEEKEGNSRLRESEGTEAELRLKEVRREHAQSEQRFESLQVHLKAQADDMKVELRSKNEELRQREEDLRERDMELSEVSRQLSEMQSLFDEVNSQLQAECSRITKLQDTVALCAQQGKDLEALQNMLEESHRMLGQVREAIEHERSERIKTTRLLEQEQQRTHLLLDVLKHFKEKLQGLTPQMLLSQLAGSDAKVASLLASELSSTAKVDASLGGAQMDGHAKWSDQGMQMPQTLPPTLLSGRFAGGSCSLPKLPEMPNGLHSSSQCQSRQCVQAGGATEGCSNSSPREVVAAAHVPEAAPPQWKEATNGTVGVQGVPTVPARAVPSPRAPSPGPTVDDGQVVGPSAACGLTGTGATANQLPIGRSNPLAQRGSLRGVNSVRRQLDMDAGAPQQASGNRLKRLERAGFASAIQREAIPT
mmetsp:Transcript_12411/g.29219  ORF Transcript_12411/g.29219 Transcript_12411/m.29219 type:complete len:642 (+) Transcript_12411:143-2068(+)